MRAYVDIFGEVDFVDYYMFLSRQLLSLKVLWNERSLLQFSLFKIYPNNIIPGAGTHTDDLLIISHHTKPLDQAFRSSLTVLLRSDQTLPYIGTYTVCRSKKFVIVATEECHTCLFDSYNSAEDFLLANPKSVFLTSKISVLTIFKHFPCRISITSAPMARVTFKVLFRLKIHHWCHYG